jgi:hypothetical protein
VAERFVVGVDREAKLLKLSLERYVAKFVESIRNSNLSEPLKTQVLAKIDTVTYRGLSVIRITVPAQRSVSLVGDTVFVRSQTSTVEAKGRALLAVTELFPRA